MINRDPFRACRSAHGQRRSRRPRLAFTLVELLVVLAIIAMLAALVFPAFGSVRESSRRAKCINNLHEIGLGMAAHHSAREAFPPGLIDRRTSSRPKARQLSWNVFLLPYVDQSALSARIDVNKAYYSAENRLAGSTVLPLFLCPSTSHFGADRQGDTTGDVNFNGRWDPGDDLAFTDYAGNFGFTGLNLPFMNGVMLWDRPISTSEVTDGLVQTILICEDTGRGAAFDGQWINGENIFDQSGPINDRSKDSSVWANNEMWSDHRGGINVLFCDGSARFVDQEIALETLAALCTRNGNERINYNQR